MRGVLIYTGAVSANHSYRYDRYNMKTYIASV